MIAAVDPISKARAAWGDTAPGWIIRLAEACAETSQNKVAARLNVSPTMISQVLSKKYPGSLQGIEELCRGEFERQTVLCPVLGEIAPVACRRWQHKADRLRTGNNQNARMFRACRACPKFRKEVSHD